MNRALTLDIKNIEVVVHRTEKTNFLFQSKGRPFDGFTMITSGSGYVTDVLGRRYSVSKGDTIITNKGDKYSFEFDSPCSYVTCGLTLETDKEILPFVYSCTKDQYKKIINICSEWQSRSWDSYAACRIGLLEIYLDILRNSKSSEPENDYISKAITYIHKNFKTNFSGQDISEYCSVSISYLRARFLKHTGQTICGYRDSLRIALAKELLRSKCFTVTEIASELGFCDVYHFSKFFTSHIGRSPTRWLEEERN